MLQILYEIYIKKKNAYFSSTTSVFHRKTIAYCNHTHFEHFFLFSVFLEQTQKFDHLGI